MNGFDGVFTETNRYLPFLCFSFGSVVLCGISIYNCVCAVLCAAPCIRCPVPLYILSDDFSVYLHDLVERSKGVEMERNCCSNRHANETWIQFDSNESCVRVVCPSAAKYVYGVGSVGCGCD